MNEEENRVYARRIMSMLSLDEKIALLSGKNYWETTPIPRLGLPSIKVTDGPNGARGKTMFSGTTAACFPAPVLLAASWNLDIARQVGRAIGQEVLSKGAQLLLGPTICTHRHPLGGRNFESFSEDPFLSGKLAAQYIHGVQETGVGATVKHFAANEQETSRLTINVIASERALREIYYKPFEIAIKEAHPWAVMTSYNCINGVHSDMNKGLLQDILRQQWGWNGLVMSDWGGTNSTEESIEAGVSIEMPGPPIYRNIVQVKSAIQSGRIREETLEERVLEVIEFVLKAKDLRKDDFEGEMSINRKEHRRLIREAGAEGIVLLKNDGNILPLDRGGVQKIALLGLAKECLAQGGGSATVNCHYQVAPWDALKTALGGDTELLYAQGASINRSFPLLQHGLRGVEGRPGLSVYRYSSSNVGRALDSITDVREARYIPIGEKWGRAKLHGFYTPSITGSHYLSLCGIGSSNLYIDDELVIEDPTGCEDITAFLFGSYRGKIKQYYFERGKDYKIRIETFQPTGKVQLPLWEGLLGVLVGFMSQQEYEFDLLPPAVQAAKEAEVAIIFVGNTASWESSGQDMQTMHLPFNGSQDRLIRAVSEVNPNTIVVISTGVPVAMPWRHRVRAILQAWFPGQEAGNSITDVILGDVNPSGRLPVSFPRSINDSPAYGNFPGDLTTFQVRYEEDIFVGYRHYDQYPDKVAFPFGFGLSYTTFEISNVGISSEILYPGSSITVSAEVRNAGFRTGSDVVQVYVVHPKSSVPMAPKSLAGFAKISLLPNERGVIHITFSLDAVAWWDQLRGKWAVDSGQYTALVARSSSDKDIKAAAFFDILESFTFDP
ncbi:glycoside hydrolase superfamily [Xylogone sp. PMI_703]|nr:glycoside hydrolase superfamily [Xylogone sp. PMI_703]